MSLKETITQDMKTAMKAGDSARLGTIRMLLAAMKQREVDERITLSDADIVALVEKAIKQRREAIAQFTAGARADLVAKETAEIAVLTPYLPAQMSEAEIDTVIAAAITSQTGKARLPTHIDLPVDQSCGLSRDSIVLLEQVRTLDKKRLRERMGHVEEAVMEKVDFAIAVSFGLPHDQMV